MNSLKVSIVTVGWNARTYLDKCLKSVYECPPSHDFEIIYVNNGSKDGSIELVKHNFPLVKIVDFDKNIGLAKAANHGIRLAKGEFVLKLDSDTVAMPGLFDTMIEFMENHPDAGAASGKCLYPNGDVQWAISKAPTPWSFFLTTLRYSQLYGPFVRAWFSKDININIDLVQEHDYPYGACCIVRRNVIDSVGLMDENIYTMAEDLEWGANMRRHGWKIFYLPQAGLLHHAGVSTIKREPQLYFVHGLRSHRYVMYKHSGWLTGFIFDALLLISAVLRTLEMVMLFLVKRCSRDPFYHFPGDGYKIMRQVFAGKTI